MPVLRYFIFVGGALLGLLLIANAWLPAGPPAAAPSATSSNSGMDLSVIRIHSDRKWPSRVVFDTTHPTTTPVPPPTVVAQAPLPPKSENDQHSKGQLRAAFAQLRPVPDPNERHSRESKRKRRSVAKSYMGQPRFMVAQQRPA